MSEEPANHLLVGHLMGVVPMGPCLIGDESIGELAAHRPRPGSRSSMAAGTSYPCQCNVMPALTDALRTLSQPAGPRVR